MMGSLGSTTPPLSRVPQGTSSIQDLPATELPAVGQPCEKKKSAGA